MGQNDPQVLGAEARTRQRDQAASELVRALLIINGGGAAALLAFLTAIWSMPTAITLLKPTIAALALLAFGALSGAAFHRFRYRASVLNQAGDPHWRRWEWLYNRSADLSLVCFFVGILVLAAFAWTAEGR